MGKNSNLHKAKSEKNDEFYTQLIDIEKEMKHYTNHFEGRVILCNCDDPTWSNFWKYFHLNFEVFGLKKLISTHYDKEETTYKMEYTGGEDENIEAGLKTPLEGNGDFQSEECIELLKEADIVITNPPFSLFRDYVAQLMEYEKKFIILSNMNAITYKEFFPYLKDNKVWIGNGFNLSMVFKTVYPNLLDNNRKFVIGKGYNPDEGYVKTPAIAWFTNLDHSKRHEKLIFWKTYNPEEYLRYDNYDAINVDKVANIPVDYDGVMGVPITFLDKYNPEQFEIVSFRKGNDGKDLVFTREREREFNRTFVSLYDVDSRDDKKRRRQDQWEAYLRENNNQTEIEPIDFFYPMSMSIGGCMNSPKDTMINGEKKYARLLIRKKAGA